MSKFQPIRKDMGLAIDAYATGADVLIAIPSLNEAADLENVIDRMRLVGKRSLPLAPVAVPMKPSPP